MLSCNVHPLDTYANLGVDVGDITRFEMGIIYPSGTHVTRKRQCCVSVAQWWATLCDPVDCSTPGFSVFHHLPEFAQTHVH